MFTVSLPRLTMLNLQRTEAYEFYNGIGFHEHSTNVSLTTSWYKWIDLNLIYGQGAAPNYYPATGLVSFPGNSRNVSATVTLRPTAHLRMDEIYYYTRLAALPGQMPSASLPTGTIFTNHLIRSKINYQFTRDYSFRAILDYNSLLPNAALVSSTYAKQADATLLFTYLPHPGTAFYLGYADTFQNVDYEAGTIPTYSVTTLPGTSTDRQVFVKFSYLLRF